MIWTLRYPALALAVALMAGTLLAEPTAGPPAWKDKASVYLTAGQAHADESASQVLRASSHEMPPAVTAIPSAAAAVSTVEAAPAIHSPAVPPAHEPPAELTSSKTSNRYLAPPSARSAPPADVGSGNRMQPTSAASQRLADFGLPMKSLYTMLSALAIVIGTFLLFMWALKRGRRGMPGRGVLPADVVSILGRVPMAARQFATLLRVGNKLVLISLTPTGAETLTEVTDPAEVDRLVGLCQQNNSYSTTKAFEQVFQQMSAETAPIGFLGNESPMTSMASPAGAYRANRGGARRG
jgi:flagellar biogenesis protein FliO